MNQVPEKLSFGQNLKQYVMKEAVIYKILRYRQNRIDLTPMRSDGPITAVGKPNNLIVLGTQNLWVLMVCRSFFTPGRDIGSAIFIVWVLVQSRMLKQDTLIV
jgi:hypothetical protein